MAKKIKLSAKREAWAKPRGAALKGPPLRYNEGDAAKYAASLEKLARQMTAEVEKEMRYLFETDAAAAHFAMDATIASQARITVNALADKFSALFARKAPKLAQGMVDTAQATSSKTLHSSLQQLAGGMSLKTSLVTGTLKETTKAAVTQNVSIIKSIAAQYLQKVEGAVMRSITTGNGLQDLVPQLENLSGQTHRRARNIALDQTRKVYNCVNRDRMLALGLKKFTWHHSGGRAEPREDHVEMDGNVYSFDNLPVIDQRTGERGIPGQAVNCGCTMSPYFDFEEPAK